MTTVSSAPSVDQHHAYRALADALRAHRLTARQIEALCEILLHLHVAVRLLDEGESPGASSFKRQDSYRLGLAQSAIRAFRHQLAALADPPTSPARFDTGQSFAVGAGSRVGEADGVATRSALEAVPDAQDAWPGAEGAEPQPAHPVDLDDMSRCPLARTCDTCQASHDDLVVVTASTPVGVVCATLCPSCLDSADPLRLDSWTAAIRRVGEHCEHLGVDVDTAAAAAG